MKNDLFPQFDRYDAKPHQSHNPKRGRPSSITRNTGVTTGMNVDDTIKEYFRRGVKLFYDTGETKTVKETFQRTLVHFFHQGWELRNDVLVPILPSAVELPTLAQFRYWYEKERGLKRSTTTYKGKYIYNERKRVDTSSMSMEVLGPGSVYKIIAVVADISLISALDRQRIIGRPVIYLIIDVFSDLIVGMSVSLEGPSWLGARLALENAAQDKVVFCKEYGFNIKEDEWPSHHLPKTIYVEPGEVLFKQVDHLAKTLNIQVINTVPFQSDWKGCFECSFRILDNISTQWLPASVKKLPEAGRKGDRLNACLTLYDFRRLLISCILEHNIGHWISDDHFDQAMVEDQVEPYPCDVWKWGIQNRAGMLREVSSDVLRLNLLPEDHALITRQGLLFHHLHYTCDRAIQEQWPEQIHNRTRRRRVPIVYDPQTSDNIYFCDAKHTKPCSLVEEDQVKFTNCSWFDVEEYFVGLELHEQVNKAIGFKNGWEVIY